ncbi:MAG: hypothetical protein Q4F97_12270 [Bacteroidales bacterium]|nr:hypothetical protein [Bacteroidales bacterium]
MKQRCAGCVMKSKYESNHSSFWVKMLKWHINFCPGWKSYFNSLSEEEKKEIMEKYKFTKY